MFATRNCALIALALVALAAASCEAGLFGHKDRNKNVVTQYVPVPSPAGGYYGAEEPHHHHHGLLGGHHGLHHNQHQGGHQVGHQGGYNGGGGGGSAAASATAAGGGSAAASAAGGASASASAASASQPSYYYPQEPEYYEPQVRHQRQQQQQHYAPQYEPMVYQPQQGGCIAPCYGGLGVQQVANMNMAPEKRKHHLFRRNKNGKEANPMIIQQQYVNNAQQPLY